MQDKKRVLNLVGIIIIVSVVVIAFVGVFTYLYFLTKNHTQDQDEQQNNNQTTDQTTDWQTYTNDVLGFKINYPKDFGIKPICGGDNLPSPKPLTSCYLGFVNQTEKKLDPDGVTQEYAPKCVINIEKKKTTEFNYSSYLKDKKVISEEGITLAGIEGKIIKISEQMDESAPQILPYYIKVYIFIERGQDTYIFEYSLDFDYAVKKDFLCDKIISTFKFIK